MGDLYKRDIKDIRKEMMNKSSSPQSHRDLVDAYASEALDETGSQHGVDTKEGKRIIKRIEKDKTLSKHEKEIAINGFKKRLGIKD